MRMQELQAKVEMNKEQLELRRELSAQTNQMRQGATETGAATKIATTAMQQARNNNQTPNRNDRSS